MRERAARLFEEVTCTRHERLEVAEPRRPVELRAEAIDLLVFDVTQRAVDKRRASLKLDQRQRAFGVVEVRGRASKRRLERQDARSGAEEIAPQLLVHRLQLKERTNDLPLAFGERLLAPRHQVDTHLTG